MSNIKSDIEIAHTAKLKHIDEIAAEIGLTKDDLIHYGPHKAKIKYDTIQKVLKKKDKGKLILVSAITPTPAGEGKTTVSIGLTQALRKLNHKAIVAIREPSLGPCFGIKGGAAGGGYSQVLPMEDINLHFTGDIHAVSAAHNLISSVLDNHIYFDYDQHISLKRVFWKRVMDMNDRSLRLIISGINKNGLARETGFEITAASEIMAILCLSNSYEELRERLSNILLGLKLTDYSPFYLKDLKIDGACTALLKDALLPNLVQTYDNTPALIHGGPFANIAQGANSILATNFALHSADYVVTEAGFGFDLGAEKFFDIVSRAGKICTSAVVLVATIRALKMHGGVKKKLLNEENVEALKKGSENLKKHVENARMFNVDVVVAINKFPSDTAAEINALKEICEELKVDYAVADVREGGGEGGLELAEKVVDNIKHKHCHASNIYDLKDTPEQKIEKVATRIYGAKGVFFLPKAKKDLELIYKHGFDKLPICIAKTQSSLSDNPKLLGRPKDFTISIREIIISSGAGFLVPLTGEIMRMPGLPKVPSATLIDVDNKGNISGLF